MITTEEWNALSEKAADAIFHAIYGPNGDPHQNRAAWRPIDEPPKEDCAVLVFYSARIYHDADGAAVSFGPVRDAVEKSEIAWFQDGCWYQSGTGHDLFEPWCIEIGNVPTHWKLLGDTPTALSRTQEEGA